MCQTEKWPVVIREEMSFWKSWIKESFLSPTEDSAAQNMGAILAGQTHRVQALR